MSRLQKLALYCAIAFLAISAIFAIIVVVAGSFDEFEVKVLLSTIAIGITSICVLASGAYRHPVLGAKIGYVAIALQLVSAVLLIAGMWADVHEDGYWQSSWILATFAIGFAHCLGLLAARLRPRQKWIQYVATAIILALCGVICFTIMELFRSDEWVVKIIAVLSILTALATLVIPILHVIAKASSNRKAGALVLMPAGDGTFIGADGRLYEVREVSER